MFILQSSDYNIEEAKHQLAKRRIKKEPWSEEDTTIFKQALQTYGKHFNKIKQLVHYLLNISGFMDSHSFFQQFYKVE